MTADFREIALSNGGFALVDAEDFERVAAYPWRRYEVRVLDRNIVVASGKRAGEHRPGFYLARMVLGADKGAYISFLNGDGLDCRKANLRIRGVSAKNQGGKLRVHSSVYRGVSWSASHDRWSAKINFNKKRTYLGYWTSEVEAARAYDRAALKIYGHHATLNFPEISSGTVSSLNLHPQLHPSVEPQL